MKLPALSPGFHAIRRDQLRPEREHDSYKRRKKPHEPSFCPECGAIFHNGRWQWGLRKTDAIEIHCPACLRIRDDFPSGFLHAHGPFLISHQDEIYGLLQHHADKAKAEHPLERIITIENFDGGEDGILITTTDIHLARDLGEALHHAYHGELEFHYNEAEKLLRVHWWR